MKLSNVENNPKYLLKGHQSSVKQQVKTGQDCQSLAPHKIQFYPLVFIFIPRYFWLECFIFNSIIPHKVIEILVNLHCVFNKFMTHSF